MNAVLRVWKRAASMIDAIKDAGDIAELRAISEHGWPVSESLGDDSPLLRRALQECAAHVVAGGELPEQSP